jgi:hypothetical protein
MNAFQEIADAAACRLLFHGLRAIVQFPQIGSSAETGFPLTVDDDRMKLRRKLLQSGRK